MKTTKQTTKKSARQGNLFDTANLVQMFIRTKTQINGLYQQHDALLAEILTRRGRKGRGGAAIRPGSVFDVDGVKYTLVDNFADTNKVYRAHGIQRYEIRPLTKKELAGTSPADASEAGT